MFSAIRVRTLHAYHRIEWQMIDSSWLRRPPGGSRDRCTLWGCSRSACGEFIPFEALSVLRFDLDQSETTQDVADARCGDSKVMLERTNKRLSLLDCHGSSRCLLSVAKRRKSLESNASERGGGSKRISDQDPEVISTLNVQHFNIPTLRW